jgi:ERCC4-type nuclease
MQMEVRWDSATSRQDKAALPSKGGTPATAACPFVVAIDTREQHPYAFESITTGIDCRPVEVRTERATLASGDYSIVGHERAVAVERKSLNDLYGTLTAGRDRFERELDRLSALSFSVVVIEATWGEIAKPPMFATKVNPASIVGTIHAWQQRYPTRWLACDNRHWAEQATYHVLRRYWIDTVEKPRLTTIESLATPWT